MNINDIIRDAAETVRGIPIFAGIDVLEEDKGDIAKNIETSIAKTSRCIVVGWNGCEHVATARPVEPGDPDALYVQPEIIVSIYENPIVNRRDKSAPRILAMAQAVARSVNNLGTEDMDEGLHFVKITPLQELDRGIVTCDVVFRTKNNI